MTDVRVTIPDVFDDRLRTAAARQNVPLDTVVSEALSDYLQGTGHRLYQVSTAAALVEGVYDGSLSSRALLEHGDLGLGTFENLNGEMVILDGLIYQVLGDGSIKLRRDDFCVPFAVISRFREDAHFTAENLASLDGLEAACDPHRRSENLFYALRIEGFFETMHTRAVHPVAKGGTLTEAAKTQPEFYFTDVEGTLVCIWSPTYARSLNIPGYHFHFISKDRTKGGHVLDCAAQTLHVAIQTFSEYLVRLPEAGPFLTADLSKDTAEALAAAE